MSGQKITFTAKDLDNVSFGDGDVAQPPPDVPAAPTPTAQTPTGAPSAMGIHADVGTGILKGAAHTAIDFGKLLSMVPGVGTATNAAGNALGGIAGQLLYGHKAEPVSNDAAFADATQRTAYSNTAQKIGGGLETAAELAVPVGEVAGAIPTTAKAGQKFQQVMGAAKDVPINVNGPGEVALRISQLAERGASMPLPVSKFLRRVTDPAKAEMTYQEARDFASNISRLSANEYSKLSPVVAREVATMRVALNEAVAQAAQKAGKGAEYKAAMREYAQAMKIKNAIESVAEGAKKGLPYATAAATGTWLTMKLRKMLGGD